MGLREEFIAVIRRKHYSIRTECSYWQWITGFLRFHRSRGPDGRMQWRHPSQMGAAEIEAYLTHLAVERKVAAATQNQALNAIVFLYKQVLEIDPGSFHAVRAKPSHRLPTVLSRREVRLLLDAVPPPTRLIAELMYGDGLRVGEACSVRVMDVDLDRLQLTVRRGKGDKDRMTPLSERLVQPLAGLIERRGTLHERDLAAGEGWVELPFAMERPPAAFGVEGLEPLLQEFPRDVWVSGGEVLPGRPEGLTPTPGIGATIVSPPAAAEARKLDCTNFSSGWRTSTGTVAPPQPTSRPEIGRAHV